METVNMPLHHRIIHHVRTHKKRIIVHVQYHHKKYIFGAWFLSGAAFIKLVGALLLFFGIGQMGWYTWADYLDIDYQAQRLAALNKIFKYDFGTTLSQLQVDYADVGTGHLAALLQGDYSSIFSDEFSHNHFVFMWKIYNIEWNKLVPEEHVIKMGDSYLQAITPIKANISDVPSIPILIKYFIPTQQEIDQMRNALLKAKQ